MVSMDISLLHQSQLTFAPPLSYDRIKEASVTDIILGNHALLTKDLISSPPSPLFGVGFGFVAFLVGDVESPAILFRALKGGCDGRELGDVVEIGCLVGGVGN